MSSSDLNLLLNIPPDEVLFDFLAKCGLSLRFCGAGTDSDANAQRRVMAEIKRADAPVRDCILASMRHIALLADAAGLDALRAASAAYLGRVSPLHLPDAPAQCALWMYLRHRDIFDDAVRMRGLYIERAAPTPLDSLRQPLTLPADLVVDSVRLYQATLLDEATGGEIAIKAPAGDVQMSVLDLLESWMPVDNPMRQDRYRVVSAKVGVEFFPEPGQTIGRSVMLALKRRGGSNLDDFDQCTRELLEAWLNHWRLTPDHDPQAGPSLPTTA